MLKVLLICLITATMLCFQGNALNWTSKRGLFWICFSEYNKSPIRINIYPTHGNERLLTVNCARIKKSNVLSENGILHETESVVVPATEDVQTIIKNHPQLTHFKNGKISEIF